MTIRRQQAPPVLRVRVGALVDALALATKRQRTGRVILRPVTARQELLVIDAGHEAIAVSVPAEGYWPRDVRVDGRKLRKLCETLPEGNLITLTLGDSVEIQNDSFKMRIAVL